MEGQYVWHWRYDSGLETRAFFKETGWLEIWLGGAWFVNKYYSRTLYWLVLYFQRKETWQYIYPRLFIISPVIFSQCPVCPLVLSLSKSPTHYSTYHSLKLSSFTLSLYLTCILLTCSLSLPPTLPWKSKSMNLYSPNSSLYHFQTCLGLIHLMPAQ